MALIRPSTWRDEVSSTDFDPLNNFGPFFWL